MVVDTLSRLRSTLKLDGIRLVLMWILFVVNAPLPSRRGKWIPDHRMELHAQMRSPRDCETLTASGRSKLLVQPAKAKVQS